MQKNTQQVGGNHYLTGMQPIEYIQANKLNFLEGCIIKRLTRYRREGGKGLEDLQKAAHELELLIKQEFPHD